ncbi:hypothetical protein VP01_15407g1, partial [Puccinia sorghi]
STEENKGVSISKSTQWDYAYSCVPGETPLRDVMHHTAVSAKESNVAKLEIGEINFETKVQTLSGHAPGPINKHLMAGDTRILN